MDTTEKTGRQWSMLWPGNWAWGMLPAFFNPLYRAEHGSGSLEGKNEYDPSPMAIGAIGAFPRVGPNGKPWPGTLYTYRVMAGHPTVAIAEAALCLAILAAEWTVELDEGLEDDATAQRIKRILELEFVNRRPALMRGLLRTVRYGWKSFEVVYARKSDPSNAGNYVGISKFKELSGDGLDVKLDDKGNLVGLTTTGTELDTPYFLHAPLDKEDDNWFGRSRFENIRRTWANYLYFEDRLKKLVDKGTGTTPRVGVPPDKDEDIKAGKRPNLETGLNLAKIIADNRESAFYNNVGLEASDFVNNADLVGKSLVSVDLVDTGNPGPAIAAISAHLAYLDKLLVRGLLQPERTLIEATRAGSRADSQEQGGIAVADAESTHELLVEIVNDQPARAVILENAGPAYVDRARLKAVPLQDERRKSLQEFFNLLLSQPAICAALFQALGDEGVKGLADQLGLKLNFAQEIDTEPQQPDGGATGAEPDGDDKQFEKELSAALAKVC